MDQARKNRLIKRLRDEYGITNREQLYKFIEKNHSIDISVFVGRVLKPDINEKEK